MQTGVKAYLLFRMIVLTSRFIALVINRMRVLDNNPIGINMCMFILDRILHDVQIHRKNEYEKEIDMSSYKGHSIDFGM